MLRISCFVFLSSFILPPSSLADDDFPATVAAFLKQHCFDCHGPHKQESRIRYDQLEGFRAADRHLWTLVHEKISAGEMPPEDRPQPSDAEKRQILTWIQQRQRALGTGSTRRLNRRELSAALQDLTGLSVEFADALPGDGTVDGFDTGADGLQDAADSVGQLMQVTRRAVDGIRFLEPATGKVFAADLRDTKDPGKVFDAWKADGGSSKARSSLQGLGVMIEPKWVGDRGGLDFTVPPPARRRGVLRLRLVVSVMKPFDDVPNPHLWVEVSGKTIDYRELTGTHDRPDELSYEVQLDDLAIDSRGVVVSLSNKVEIPYSVKGFENEDRSKPEENIPGGTGWFRPAFDGKQPPDKQPVPFIILQQIEIQPDYVAAWPPESWPVGRALLPVAVEQPVEQPNEQTGKSARPTIEDNEECARQLLGIWIERAWRRPVSAVEQGRFFALYRELRAQGMSFDDSLRATFQSVLLSGGFRYLTSPADKDAVVAQHAIASRLSFMLIGAPPDDELRRLAAAGKLREPAVLDAQVDRLLADPRSDAFVRPFVTQWLEMGQPITIAMDHIQKQDFRFGRYLKASMHEETLAYVAELFRENRPARELIVSDWTMMNNILAIHYGYEGIEGGQLRKVKLRPDDPRGGGILGHAGIQSMLCWMGENWLIYRGAWTLRHILDAPPPPPPLEVPELIPSDGANRGKTFKELLQQHQADAKCAVCHKNIDPVGFAFQSFDLSGRWREVEYESYARNELDGKIEWRGVGKTRPVDSAGHLPRGEAFTGFAEFKELVVREYLDDMVRGLLKNLMLYATGRKPDVDDMAEIRTIMKEQADNGYPLRDLVKAVVRSQAFLEH